MRDFALACGDEWKSAQGESRTAKVRRTYFEAERQAQAILARRAEERDLILCAEHRELYGEILAAKDLLELFYRRPDLAAEFPTLVVQTECEYGQALFSLSVLEARLNGEME